MQVGEIDNVQRDQQRMRPISWQNPEQDKPVRQTMITKIYNLLRLRKPDADEDWLKKLPDMAKRLEDKLYRHAGSMAEYNDDSTLKPRLQQIATEMRRDPAAQQHHAPNPPITVSTQGIQPLPLHPPPASSSANRSVSSSPPASYHPSSAPGTPLFSDYPAPPSNHPPNQQPPYHYPSHHNQPSHAQPLQQTHPPSHHSSQQPSSSNQPHQTQPAPTQPSSSSRSPSGGAPSQRDVLRQQQQRLLLLRHASKCPAKPGECRATQHCSQMKTLWRHIANCKDQNCHVPHCVSSRFVLAHYHRCTDQHCDVCEPVRAAINRNNVDKSQQQQNSAGAGAPNPLMVAPSTANGQSLPQHPQISAPPQLSHSSSQQHIQPPPAHSKAPSTPSGANGSSMPLPSVGGGSQPQYPSGDYNLNALIAKYITHWKLITANADAARKKQEAFEIAKQEEKNKEKEAKEAKEMEKQLPPQPEGARDEVLEAHHRAIRLKYESAKAAAKAAQLQCQLLEAEVRTMKLQHEKNVQIEKQLQAEFIVACNKDAEKVKRCVHYARSQATQNTASSHGPGGQQHPPQPPPPQPHNPHVMPTPPPPRPQVQAPPPQTVAALPADAVVNASTGKKGKKEPKEKKPPKEKVSKKDKNAAAAQASLPIPNAPLAPMIPGMGLPYAQAPPHPPPPQVMNQQNRPIPMTMPISSSLPPGANVPPPPPSKSSGKNSQPATPRASPARSLPPGTMPPGTMPVAMAPIPHHQHPAHVSVFHEVPSFNRTVLETSLINTFHRRDIEAHIQSLSRYSKEMLQNKFKDTALALLKKCQDADAEKIFEYPVDPQRDCAPGYFDIIKKPMDFSTVRSKLDSNDYSNLSQFVADIRLIFANCMKYNPPTSIYYETASLSGRYFEKEYARHLEAEEERCAKERYDVNHCRLCGQTAFTFEQIAYYCAGPCQRRIGRTVPMFSSSDNRHWCNSCFQNDLPETIVLNDGTSINKRELRRGKHPEPVEEGWVMCYCCKRWFHQVCAMLNTKRGQDTKKDDFLCPFCVLGYLDHQKTDRARINGIPETKRACAKDLPETDLSKFLEKAVNLRVNEFRKEFCAKTRQNLRDVEDVSPLCVRVVMAKDADVWTRAHMMKVYPKFPKSFNSRQKVVLMFEKLDGVDVLIFIMFLQHYGSDCPAPNARCLYIAYLDSVYYFRPSFVRTAVYHELITSVLDFEKRRGITRCFIWACPPTGGDDYIFHVHPKNQKTPKPDRLRMWYLTLLEDARLRGIVISVTNLFDEYLSRVSDLADVPYFEGDCWPTYAEHYIQEMEQKGTDPRARQPRNEAIRGAQSRKSSGAAALNESFSNRSGGPKRQKRAKSASSGKGLKARSASQVSENGINGGEDEMDVISEMPTALMCPPPKPLEQVPLQSLITARIALENDRMKDDFIVVKMYYDCAECAAPMDYPGALYWVPKIYTPDKDPHDYRKRRYAPPYCLCHECYLSAYQAEFGVKPEYEEPAFPPPEWAEEYSSWKASSASNQTGDGTGSSSTPPASTPQKEESESQSSKKNQLSPTSSPAPNAPENTAPSTTKRKAGGPGRKRKATGADVTDLDTIESTIEVLEPGKIAKPPNPYGSPIPLSDMRIEVAMIRPKTVDPDPLIECQIFNLREDFLSLCQGNKYQFDELRRAKHSSMMILYHLHNPESDAFVHTCNGCKMDITTARYTCMTCQDFDLCQNCNGKVKHAHPLEKVTSSTSSLGGDMESEGSSGGSGDAAAQQAKNNHTAYLQILEHCSTCENPNCPVPNCIRMKKLLEHAPSCSIRISGGCANCKRYWQFLAFHARQCRQPAGQCKVPHCERIKGHIRAQANKIADRRMMALMQRTNQAAVPPPSDEQSNSYQMDVNGAPNPVVNHPSIPSHPPPAPGGRNLTSPRGKGGKGPRMAN